jgi:hypothetical protein
MKCGKCPGAGRVSDARVRCPVTRYSRRNHAKCCFDKSEVETRGGERK